MVHEFRNNMLAGFCSLIVSFVFLVCLQFVQASPSVAPMRRIIFNDGKIVDAMIFKSDGDKVFLLEKTGTPGDSLTEVSIAGIKSIDGSVRTGEMVYRRELIPLNMRVVIEVDEDARVMAQGLVKGFNDGFETLDFFDFQIPMKLNSIQDEFGHPLNWRLEVVDKETEKYRIRLNRPVHPGEDFMLKIKWKISDARNIGSKTYSVKFVIPQNLPQITSLHFLLPMSVSGLWARPEPLLNGKSIHGKVLTYSGEILKPGRKITVTFRDGN